ncbi:MAG: Type prenyl endopeptidase Rce1-like [Thermoanaerobaculia bacterium]|jgi:membrane protease YdiL (CAAX protease family)|nr:Type prenyl endopeptidase Rce1-like [Thermoanaerobaculia bacterium]
MIRALVPDEVNAAGVMLLLFVGLVLPALIVRSARRLGSGPLPISRPRFFRQTIIFQMFVALLSAWVAWTHGILSLPLPQQPLIAWGAAVLLYFVMLTTLKLRWKGRSAAAKQRLYDILPRTPSEFGLYVIVCIVAGVGEEFIYRGVLTALLQRITGITIVTIVTLSLSFAAAHAMQGLRSVAGIFVIALACHALVWLAQSLIPIMVVHFAYDLTAGILIPRWGASEVRS